MPRVRSVDSYPSLTASGAGSRLTTVLFATFLIAGLIALPAFAQIQINEIRIDQPGTDNDEYFELAGPAGASLDGLTYLVIGDGAGGSGVIEEAEDLTGLAIPGSGFFVAAESTFTVGVADFTTSLNFENSDNVTHLLVDGFTGANGDDLDTNDDGVLDVTPWASVVDLIALVEEPNPPTGTEFHYGPPEVGPDGSFVPGHSFRCGSFIVGEFTTGVDDTPGAVNACPIPEIVIHEIIQNPAAVSDANGEWFEVFNPTAAAIDIDGWTISDNDFDSHVIANGGPLLVPAGGFLVLGVNGDVMANGGVTVDYVFSGVALANGADELVLTDTAANEIDRVEWDDGATFPDPTGASMSLVSPALDNNVGANWCEASTPFGDGDLGTPGAANDCMVTADEVVINEILQNPAAVSDGNGEWFEVFNPTAAAIDVDGWTIADNDFDSHVIANGGPLLVPAGGFLVLGTNGDVATNGGVAVDYVFSGIALANGADELVLFDTALTEVDRVEWDGGPAFPDPNGASMSLSDPGLDNNVGANWCEASTPFGDGDFGTPGTANDCPEPKVVINEIDYDQPGSDNAEFVELTNVGGATADLSAFTLELVNGAGGGAAVYQTVALPAVNLAPGEYFVICADLATVANCNLDALSSIQNGAPDAVALTLGGMVVDTVSYEGDVPGFTEGSGAGLADSGSAGEDNKSIARLPDGIDTDQNNVDFAFVCITPGGGNLPATTGCTPTGPVFEIFDIQGSGLVTPFLNLSVMTADNVVTAVTGNGFFMQTPDARTDGDPATSDGIFVFTGAPPAVAVGDFVTVSGDVIEFNPNFIPATLTEFSNNPVVIVTSSGNPLPTVVPFDATTPGPTPSPQSDQLERFEGMLVSFTGLASGPSDRFGDVAVVTQASRSFREPGIEFPGLPGLPVWDGNPEVFEIDPDGAGLPDVDIFAEQVVTATGPLSFAFGDYQVLPTSLTLGAVPPLPTPVRARMPGELTIASQNMLRFFDDVDDPGVGDPVLTTQEFNDLLVKFSAHIRDNLGSPDVLAVQEVENINVLTSLAAQILADDPAVSYSGHLIEGNDVGGIDVGYLTRDDTIVVNSVDQFGENLLFSFDGTLLHDRPPLVLDATYVGGGGAFPLTVIDVHQRSLGGIDDPVDGTRVKLKRLEQAETVAQFIQDLQVADPAINLVVTGDFNAFQFTDGFVDVLGIFTGDLDPLGAEFPGSDLIDPNLANQVLALPAEERYSFVFGGNAQVLDHALTSVSLSPFVSGIEFARGNADAPDSFNMDPATTLRASDHDGLVLFLKPDSDGDGVVDAADFCPATTIPEGVPTVVLGFFRYALTDGDSVFDTSVPSWWPFGVPSFTTEDTAGCSCEQIVDELGLTGFFRNLQTKFGCSLFLMKLWSFIVDYQNESIDPAAYEQKLQELLRELEREKARYGAPALEGGFGKPQG